MSSVEPDPASQNIPKAAWRDLAQKKIYFGHMSVGFNILSGVRDLMKEEPGPDLKILGTSDPADFGEPVFAHSPIGKNAYPLSKIDAFRQVLESGVGAIADIAFFKLCYVDIHGGTDVEALAGAYDAMMRDMREKFPQLTIVAVTAPLTVVPAGLKTTVKKMLGRGEPDKTANAKREAFNAHLRETYGPLVFDLAALESTLPDGQRVTYEMDGQTYYALEPSYSDDGGHLNATGRRIVAAGLLKFLAGLTPTA